MSMMFAAGRTTRLMRRKSPIQTFIDYMIFGPHGCCGVFNRPLASDASFSAVFTLRPDRPYPSADDVNAFIADNEPREAQHKVTN